MVSQLYYVVIIEGDLLYDDDRQVTLHVWFLFTTQEDFMIVLIQIHSIFVTKM